MSDKLEKLLARISYNKVEGRYEVMLSTDGGEEWDLSKSYKCVYSASQDEEAEEPMFVYVGLVEDIRELARFGYRIVF